LLGIGQEEGQSRGSPRGLSGIQASS
jgi:hypothetical protein